MPRIFPLWLAPPGANIGVILFFFLAGATVGCAVNPVTGQQEFVLMSEQQELAIGNQANRQVLQQYQVYPDQQLQIYVASVGQRLARISHRKDLSYHFTVLDSTEINAFALPGGYIYITRGLLAYLNSEAELAAVLGHEIGHVTARHSVRQQTSARAAGVGAGILSILLPELANAGLGQTVNVLGTALLSGYGREHELEADRLGADYLAHSGYDPQAMLAVIRTLKEHEILESRLAREEGRRARIYHGVFSTHPDNDTRLREIIAHAASQGTTADALYRDRFLDEIDGLIFGPNPTAGVVTGADFYHPALGFAVQFPAGWEVANQPDQIIAVNPRKTAQVQLTTRQVESGMTPRKVLAESRIGTLTAEERLDAAGVDGITGIATVNMEGGSRTVRISALVLDRQAFVIVGMAREPGQLAQFDEVFKDVAESFHRLTATERAGAHGNRLRVVTLNGAISWRTLARSSPLQKLPETHLKLLNAAPNEALAPTTRRIKVVE